MSTKTNNLLNTLNTFRVKHEPEILMSMGLAGLTFSVAWGIKSTIKAVRLCDEVKKKENKEKLTAKEVIKTTWKLYLPVVITTGLSIPCVILGNRVSSKRNAALAAAYTISETAMQEYKEKAKEIVGEEKAKKIEEEVNKDKASKKESSAVIIGEGETLFYEPLTDRYFKSTWNDIQKAANELNEEALGSATGQFSLNDWFEKLGLPSTEIGDSIGWGTSAYDCCSTLLRIDMTTAKTKDNKPCGCICYETKPKALY